MPVDYDKVYARVRVLYQPPRYYIRWLVAQERCSAVPGGRNKIFRDDVDERGGWREKKMKKYVVLLSSVFVFVVVSAHDE